ncbi:MAG: hypothetical protein FT714_12185 [Pantoea sp. Pent]|nr:hypothetical protein [Pantoea sp. Pent]
MKIKVGEGGVVLSGYSNKKVNFSSDGGPFNNEWNGEVGDEKRILLTAKLPYLEEGDWAGSAILMVTLE